jgi:hypothetical protein
LTTQDQKLTRENHDHKGPGSFIRNCCKNTHPQVRVCPRCSRPLCSSQTTTPSTRPPTPTNRGAGTNRKQEQKKHQNVSPCIAAKRSCCLRTQQCAKHNPHKPRPGTFPTPPHPPKGGTALPY